MNARGIDFTGLAYLVAIGVVGYGVYRLAKAGPNAAKAAGEAVAAAVTKTIDAINPVNPGNVVNQGATAAFQTVTGDPDANIGVTFWEWLHPGARKMEQQMLGTWTEADINGVAESRSILDRAFASAATTTAWPAGTGAGIDAEDAGYGKAIGAAGAGVPMAATPGFSFLTRPYGSF